MTQTRRAADLARPARSLLVACSAVALLGWNPAAAEAQTPQGRQGGAGQPQRNLRNVLGGVPMTAADSAVNAVVQRLDFDSYKNIVKGLTEFGDREQGTERNARAVDWIEAQLRGWGYETERIHYMFAPRGGGEPEPREEVYATKIGSTTPQEMYILGAHMDGRGGGQAANDDGSGTALVMEIARVLAAPDIRTDRSIRFALWNNEETGLNGARAYVQQRQALQGKEDPAGSGRYPEPRWLGMIQHDMMLWDHGMPRPDGTYNPEQRPEADVNIEFQSQSKRADDSMKLAFHFRYANEKYATDYPAAVGPHMTNTDSTPFMDIVPAISLRENERGMHTGAGWNPTWHQPIDVFTTFSDKDFRLGLNAAQTTLGAVAELAGAKVKK